MERKRGTTKRFCLKNSHDIAKMTEKNRNQCTKCLDSQWWQLVIRTVYICVCSGGIRCITMIRRLYLRSESCVFWERVCVQVFTVHCHIGDNPTGRVEMAPSVILHTHTHRGTYIGSVNQKKSRCEVPHAVHTTGSTAGFQEVLKEIKKINLQMFDARNHRAVMLSVSYELEPSPFNFCSFTQWLHETLAVIRLHWICKTKVPVLRVSQRSSLVVQQRTLLYRLPDGSRVNRLWLVWVFVFWYPLGSVKSSQFINVTDARQIGTNKV